MAERVLGFLPNEVDGRAIEIAFENDRMNVALPADGGGIAEAFGHALDRGDEILLCLRLGVETFELSQRERGQYRSRPRAKIFRGKFRAREFAEIIVYVLGFHVLRPAGFVDILKKILTR